MNERPHRYRATVKHGFLLSVNLNFTHLLHFILESLVNCYFIDWLLYCNGRYSRRRQTVALVRRCFDNWKAVGPLGMTHTLCCVIPSNITASFSAAQLKHDRSFRNFISIWICPTGTIPGDNRTWSNVFML